MHETLVLEGCAPTPLASYLKALGILRLISSPDNNITGKAADPDARGWWENERFHLRTMLTRDAVLEFFLNEYAPSPIIAPWNGGSGFYPNDNKDGFNPLTAEMVAKRFQTISSTIRDASGIIDRLKLEKRPEGDAKEALVATLRAELPDSALAWLDATLALSGQGLAYPQLLGTGGNDGRLDFTNNFMRRLVAEKKPTGLFNASDGKPSRNAELLLLSALFATSSPELSSASVGQFSPGAAGGPNGTTGYEAGGKVNSWNFVLMLEGAAAFAGAVSRRHQSVAGSGASFPFTVRAVGAGWGGVGSADENDARAEFWAPLWTRQARFCEIDSLLGEGRAVLNGRTARDGIDFARAAASLGVSRGFSEFQRFGFLMRSGKAYLATPIGRRSVASSSGTRLVSDLDVGQWLERTRRVGRRDGEPAAAKQSIKQLEDALLSLLAPAPTVEQVQTTFIALGQCVKWLAVSPDGRRYVGSPPPALSSSWIRQANDGTPEFRIAAALASLGLPSPRLSGELASASQPSASETNTASATRDESVDGVSVDSVSSRLPMAAHFAPIDEKRFFNGVNLSRNRTWASTTPPTLVWGTGNLVSNMIAVLERRIVEAPMRGLPDKPLDSAAYARAEDVTAFLEGNFDDARCAALLTGLVWAIPAWLGGKMPRDAPPIRQLPFAYAALKPIFSTNAALRRIEAIDGTACLPLPKGMLTRLRAAGDRLNGHATDEAVRAAFNRGRASGLVSPFDPARLHGSPSSRIGAGIRADRLAASLLIPIGDRTLKNLLARAYANNDTHIQETNDAA